MLSNKIIGTMISILSINAIIKVGKISTQNNITLKNLIQKDENNKRNLKNIFNFIYLIVELTSYTIIGFLMYYGKISIRCEIIISIIMFILLKSKKNKNINIFI